jgi:hypothetical protein
MAAGLCECLLRGWVFGRDPFYGPITQLGLCMVLIGEAVRKLAMVSALRPHACAECSTVTCLQSLVAEYPLWLKGI